MRCHGPGVPVAERQAGHRLAAEDRRRKAEVSGFRETVAVSVTPTNKLESDRVFQPGRSRSRDLVWVSRPSRDDGSRCRGRHSRGDTSREVSQMFVPEKPGPAEPDAKIRTLPSQACCRRADLTVGLLLKSRRKSHHRQAAYARSSPGRHGPLSPRCEAGSLASVGAGAKASSPAR